MGDISVSRQMMIELTSRGTQGLIQQILADGTVNTEDTKAIERLHQKLEGLVQDDDDRLLLDALNPNGWYGTSAATVQQNLESLAKLQAKISSHELDPNNVNFDELTQDLNIITEQQDVMGYITFGMSGPTVTSRRLTLDAPPPTSLPHASDDDAATPAVGISFPDNLSHTELDNTETSAVAHPALENTPAVEGIPPENETQSTSQTTTVTTTESAPAETAPTLGSERQAALKHTAAQLNQAADALEKLDPQIHKSDIRRLRSLATEIQSTKLTPERQKSLLHEAQQKLDAVKQEGSIPVVKEFIKQHRAELEQAGYPSELLDQPELMSDVLLGKGAMGNLQSLQFYDNLFNTAQGIMSFLGLGAFTTALNAPTNAALTPPVTELNVDTDLSLNTLGAGRKALLDDPMSGTGLSLGGLRMPKLTAPTLQSPLPPASLQQEMIQAVTRGDSAAVEALFNGERALAFQSMNREQVLNLTQTIQRQPELGQLVRDTLNHRGSWTNLGKSDPSVAGIPALDDLRTQLRASQTALSNVDSAISSANERIQQDQDTIRQLELAASRIQNMSNVAQTSDSTRQDLKKQAEALKNAARDLKAGKTWEIPPSGLIAEAMSKDNSLPLDTRLLNQAGQHVLQGRLEQVDYDFSKLDASEQKPILELLGMVSPEASPEEVNSQLDFLKSLDAGKSDHSISKQFVSSVLQNNMDLRETGLSYQLQAEASQSNYKSGTLTQALEDPQVQTFLKSTLKLTTAPTREDLEKLPLAERQNLLEHLRKAENGDSRGVLFNDAMASLQNQVTAFNQSESVVKSIMGDLDNKTSQVQARLAAIDSRTDLKPEEKTALKGVYETILSTLSERPVNYEKVGQQMAQFNRLNAMIDYAPPEALAQYIGNLKTQAAGHATILETQALIESGELSQAEGDKKILLAGGQVDASLTANDQLFNEHVPREAAAPILQEEKDFEAAFAIDPYPISTDKPNETDEQRLERYKVDAANNQEFTRKIVEYADLGLKNPSFFEKTREDRKFLSNTLEKFTERLQQLKAYDPQAFNKLAIPSTSEVAERAQKLSAKLSAESEAAIQKAELASEQELAPRAESRDVLELIRSFADILENQRLARVEGETQERIHQAFASLVEYIHKLRQETADKYHNAQLDKLSLQGTHQQAENIQVQGLNALARSGQTSGQALSGLGVSSEALGAGHNRAAQARLDALNEAVAAADNPELQAIVERLQPLF
jgi:hypothetical protein